MPDQQETFDPCCKDMTTALSFPYGRHFFVEDGIFLTVAKTAMQGGGEAVLEHPVRFCPFCGKSTAGRLRFST